MKRSMIGFGLSFLIILIAFIEPVTADWPQFQGPNRDGHAVDQGIAKSWPADGPKELWSVPLGEGFAGPAIVDGEVYILDRVDSKCDVLRCLNLDTGKELWTYTNESPGETGFNGSRGTPTVDEKYVYAVGQMGDMLCVDRNTHQLVWKKNLLSDIGGRMSLWGVAQSPVLYKNLVIVAPHGRDAFVVALDQDTGKEVWRSVGIGGPAYTSPALVTLGGIQQIVVIAPSGELPEYGTEDDDEESEEDEEEEENDRNEPPGTVAGISPDNGEILWIYRGWSCWAPIPYPIRISEDRLFVTGAYDAGSAMLEVTNNDNNLSVREIYRLDQNDFGLQIHQPILYNGHLYANNNGNEHRAGLTCLSLDGKVIWRTKENRKLPRFDKGNLIMTDNLLINLEGKKGTLHLIEPSPEGYKELAQAKVLSGKMMWSPMAISQGKLLVRNQKEMKCLDLRNP